MSLNGLNLRFYTNAIFTNCTTLLLLSSVLHDIFKKRMDANLGQDAQSGMEYYFIWIYWASQFQLALVLQGGLLNLISLILTFLLKVLVHPPKYFVQNPQKIFFNLLHQYSITSNCSLKNNNTSKLLEQLITSKTFIYFIYSHPIKN